MTVLGDIGREELYRKQSNGFESLSKETKNGNTKEKNGVPG